VARLDDCHVRAEQSSRSQVNEWANMADKWGGEIGEAPAKLGEEMTKAGRDVTTKLGRCPWRSKRLRGRSGRSSSTTRLRRAVGSSAAAK